MNECQSNHEKILYSGTECPLCRERQREDDLRDSKTDIDEENIMDLFKRVERLEKAVFPLFIKRRFWNIQNKQFEEKKEPVQ